MVARVDYARLSQAVYDDNSQPDGWERLSNAPPNDSGLRWSGFVRQPEG
jgi:hypothetical protein